MVHRNLFQHSRLLLLLGTVMHRQLSVSMLLQDWPGTEVTTLPLISADRRFILTSSLLLLELSQLVYDMYCPGVFLFSLVRANSDSHPHMPPVLPS